LSLVSKILLIVLCGAISAFGAEREVIDRIAVVVGNEVILATELANQVQLAAFQSGSRPETQAEIARLQEEVLERMISDKLFLMEARKDTNVVVRRDEVDQALDEQIARVISNFNSESEFIQALAQEGMSLRDLEKRYRSEIENNLLRQRYIQRKLYDVSVSKHEVEQFYSEFEDSIPEQPEAVKLSHILLEVRPDSKVEDSVQALATELRQQILDGADFATISAQYSSFGAGADGGDLGYVDRGDVVPEFARAAFQLTEGNISGVIRTQFGYHVIRCEGKRDEKLRLRHFLLGVEPSAEDTLRTVALADSLMAEIRNGSDFGDLAKAFSVDVDSRSLGGELGWFATHQVPDGFEESVVGWNNPGEIRGPVKTQFGLHILKLLEYQAQKRYTVEEDFDRVKEMARQDKTGRIVDEWIGEIKLRTLIEYRLEDEG